METYFTHAWMGSGIRGPGQRQSSKRGFPGMRIRDDDEDKRPWPEAVLKEGLPQYEDKR